MSAFVTPFRHSAFGFRMMMLSNIDTGAGSVDVSALPTLPSTCSTSGTLLMIVSCTWIIRLASVIETFGRVTGI